MKRLALALALLTLVPVSQATARPYHLTKNKAETMMRIGLSRQFDGAFTYGYRRTVRCRHRKKWDVIGCEKIRWLIGDTEYRGHGLIWITYPNGRAYWNYRYRIKRIDYYCLDHGGSRCVKWFVTR